MPKQDKKVNHLVTSQSPKSVKHSIHISLCQHFDVPGENQNSTAIRSDIDSERLQSLNTNRTSCSHTLDGNQGQRSNSPQPQVTCWLNLQWNPWSSGFGGDSMQSPARSSSPTGSWVICVWSAKFIPNFGKDLPFFSAKNSYCKICSNFIKLQHNLSAKSDAKIPNIWNFLECCESEGKLANNDWECWVICFFRKMWTKWQMLVAFLSVCMCCLKIQKTQ